MHTNTSWRDIYQTDVNVFFSSSINWCNSWNILAWRPFSHQLLKYHPECPCTCLQQTSTLWKTPVTQLWVRQILSRTHALYIILYSQCPCLLTQHQPEQSGHIHPYKNAPISTHHGHPSWCPVDITCPSGYPWVFYQRNCLRGSTIELSQTFQPFQASRRRSGMRWRRV